MPEQKSPSSSLTRRETFFEKLVRRILTSVGGIFDRIFGASAQNAIPQTSDLSERLKGLIDSRLREGKNGRRIAPHLIRLKYSWGQTTEEFNEAFKSLKTELLVAAIDHINDNRYLTLSPVKIIAKPDILTEGFSLAVGFDETDANQAEHLDIPSEIFAKVLPPEALAKPERPKTVSVTAKVKLPGKDERELHLEFVLDGKSNLTVGRVKESDLFLDDASVSKHHASLVMNHEGVLRVADIGSTNGTHLDGERIAYGKAYEVTTDKKVAFGSVQVNFAWEMPAPEPEPAPEEIHDTGEVLIDAGESSPDDMQIKIGTNASTEQNDFADEEGEPETHFGTEKEPETVMKSSEKEPETVFSAAEEPETAFNSSVREPETVFNKKEASEIVLNPTTNLSEKAVEKSVPYDSMVDFSTDFSKSSNSRDNSPDKTGALD